jgi:hypothetical protein
VLIGAAVPLGAGGQLDVTVSVPGGKPSAQPGFKVIPLIYPGQNLVGRRGETVTVRASGVTGLGSRLPDLIATIGGEAAATTLSADRDLVVTIPAKARTGETTLALATQGGGDEAPITVND